MSERTTDWANLFLGFLLGSLLVGVGFIAAGLTTSLLKAPEAEPTETRDETALVRAVATAIAQMPTPMPTPAALEAAISEPIEPMPAAIPPTPTANFLARECGVAEQLGPWAPSTSGDPERFEVDATQGVVHASLWFPGESPENTEYSVILDNVRIGVIGAGTAWQWPACHDVSFAREDALKHGQRRLAAGKTTIQITLEELSRQYPNNIEVLPNNR
ncbi:MAG: hypothetical protein KatS3mg091_738 [Patescibacteria group bacterium]|nr:MAG: hypothetical protein KatS3mg091_738 [Patescibacteria group bacterium]